MKGRLSMAKSGSGGVFLTDGQHQCLPMAIAGRLPMAPRSCRLTHGGVLVDHEGIVLCFP